jgi:hypothetical protein
LLFLLSFWCSPPISLALILVFSSLSSCFDVLEDAICKKFKQCQEMIVIEGILDAIMLARTNATNEPTNANEYVHVPSMGIEPIVENEQA